MERIRENQALEAKLARCRELAKEFPHGSTAQMIDYVKSGRPARVVMLTECSMSDNVAAEVPDVEFVRPCNLCPHMKRITLPKIRRALETLRPEVKVDREIAARARAAVDRMLAVR